ncbi:MAG: hypothetical protein H7305_09285 [Gemmatimonadaceae bacterium]|nr:hypothetical protein [Gemmatimonadaceae bacterium]
MLVGLYVASLITSASWDLQNTERFRQLRQRALAWRHIREDPRLRQKLHNQLPSLRDEAAAIARHAFNDIATTIRCAVGTARTRSRTMTTKLMIVIEVVSFVIMEAAPPARPLAR